ncbi:MAG: hypothetical protein ACO1TE_27805 [Prosthecobacter sp.]
MPAARLHQSSVMAALSVMVMFAWTMPAPAQTPPGGFTPSRLSTVRDGMAHTGATPSSDFASQLDLLEVEVLGETAEPQPWTAAFGTSGFHTNNAALNDINKVDDYFGVASAMVAFQPKITDSIAALLAVRQDVYRYDEFEALDFEYLEASAGATFRLAQVPNTVATLRYVYTRLTGNDWDSAFFEDHGIAAGLSTRWRYSETFGLVAGVNAQVCLAPQPSSGRRDDYSVYVAAVIRPVEKLEITAGYTGSYFAYGFAGRDDFNHVLRVGAVFRPVRWFWIGASASYAFNYSNVDAFDYGAFTAGLGMGAEFHF